MATTVEPTSTTTPSSDRFELSDKPFLTPQRIRIFGIVAAIVAVAALAAWFVITAGNRKEAFAASALDDARNAAEQGNLPLAAQKFEQVSTTYAGTAAAHEASLGLVQVRLVGGQDELAIATLDDLLKANPPAAYAAPANALLGTAYENTGKFVEAAAAYRKGADQAITGYLKATYLLDAARASRLAGKADEAKTIYRDIIARFGETAARTEAEVRLAEMNRGTL